MESPGATAGRPGAFADQRHEASSRSPATAIVESEAGHDCGLSVEADGPGRRGPARGRPAPPPPPPPEGAGGGYSRVAGAGARDARPALPLLLSEHLLFSV